MDSKLRTQCAGLAVYEAGFGEGTGRIWLDRVQCLGNERELMDCTASSSGMNTCTHTQDVGVRCPLGMNNYYTLLV